MSNCPVDRTVYGNPCDGPGTYYCDSDLWGSACRRHFEQPVPETTETTVTVDATGEVGTP